MSDIVTGSIAGMAGKLLEYPFDTIKVRLQSSLMYRGPLDCIRLTLRQEGLPGFYRGLSPPLFGAAAENACLFYSYNLTKQWINREGLGAKVAAGAISGAITSWVLTPIELVKCQLQVGQPSHPLRVIRRIFQHDGVGGFWRGQMGTFFRETGGSAAWFGAYELVCMKTRNSDGKVPLIAQLSAGACAGMGYNLALYPADTVKARMQTETQLYGWHEVGTARAKAVHAAESFVSRSPGFWQAAKAVYKESGFTGFYRGAGITVARSAPSSAIIFYVYNWLDQAFQEKKQHH